MSFVVVERARAIDRGWVQSDKLARTLKPISMAKVRCPMKSGMDWRNQQPTKTKVMRMRRTWVERRGGRASWRE